MTKLKFIERDLLIKKSIQSPKLTRLVAASSMPFELVSSGARG